jgi:hypothetical protein
MRKTVGSLIALGCLSLLGACSSSEITTPVANGTSTASAPAATTTPTVRLEDVEAFTSDGYPASFTIVVRLGENSSRSLELFAPLRAAATAFIADHTSTELLSQAGKKELSAVVVSQAAHLHGVTVEATFVTNFTLTL